MDKHKENAELLPTKFGSNIDKPKGWVKNFIKKIQLKVKVKILNYIFNPTIWVCPYLTQIWVKKNPALFRVWHSQTTNPEISASFTQPGTHLVTLSKFKLSFFIIL